MGSVGTSPGFGTSVVARFSQSRENADVWSLVTIVNIVNNASIINNELAWGMWIRCWSVVIHTKGIFVLPGVELGNLIFVV